jgi:hypothetical protein
LDKTCFESLTLRIYGLSGKAAFMDQKDLKEVKGEAKRGEPEGGSPAVVAAGVSFSVS